MCFTKKVVFTLIYSSITSSLKGDVVQFGSRLTQYRSVQFGSRLTQYRSVQFGSRLTQYRSVQFGSRLTQYWSVQFGSRLTQCRSVQFGSRLTQYRSVQFGSRLTQCRSVIVRTPSKASVVSLSKKLYLRCLILVGSRNGAERDFTIELQ